MARASWAAYTRAIAALDRFLRQFDVAARLLVAPSNVALFVSPIHNQKYAASTIETYGLAIGYIHKLHGLPNPTENFLVRKAITEANKNGMKPDIKASKYGSITGQWVDALQFCSTTSFHKVLFTCMYLVAFAAFLWVWEVTLSGDNKENVLQFNNIQFNQETGGWIFFWQFQTL